MSCRQGHLWFDGVLNSNQEDPFYIGGKKRVFIIDNEISESRTIFIKIMYSLKYETLSICAHVPTQEDLTIMLYLHDIYNIDLYICH